MYAKYNYNVQCTMYVLPTVYNVHFTYIRYTIYIVWLKVHFTCNVHGALYLYTTCLHNVNIKHGRCTLHTTHKNTGDMIVSKGQQYYTRKTAPRPPSGNVDTGKTCIQTYKHSPTIHQRIYLQMYSGALRMYFDVLQTYFDVRAIKRWQDKPQ